MLDLIKSWIRVKQFVQFIYNSELKKRSTCRTWTQKFWNKRNKVQKVVQLE